MLKKLFKQKFKRLQNMDTREGVRRKVLAFSALCKSKGIIYKVKSFLLALDQISETYNV